MDNETMMRTEKFGDDKRYLLIDERRLEALVAIERELGKIEGYASVIGGEDQKILGKSVDEIGRRVAQMRDWE